MQYEKICIETQGIHKKNIHLETAQSQLKTHLKGVIALKYSFKTNTN